MFTFSLVNLAIVSTVAVIPFCTASPAQARASTSTTQAATNLCGDYDYIVLQNTPWIVYNMLYNADKIVGSQCTGYQKTVTDSNTQKVFWNSTTDIEYVESTYVESLLFEPIAIIFRRILYAYRKLGVIFRKGTPSWD